jgi:hypothetical protein
MTKTVLKHLLTVAEAVYRPEVKKPRATVFNKITLHMVLGPHLITFQTVKTHLLSQTQAFLQTNT